MFNAVGSLRLFGRLPFPLTPALSLKGEEAVRLRIFDGVSLVP